MRNDPPSRRPRVWAAAPTLVAIGLMVGPGLGALGAWQRPEAALWDWRARFWESRETVVDSVRVVLIDSEALQFAADSLGWPWPWPRSMYDRLLEFLGRAGARSLTFDMEVDSPSAWGWPADSTFADQLGRWLPVVLPIHVGDGSAISWPVAAPRWNSGAEPLMQGRWTGQHPQVARPPLPEFAAQAAALGASGASSDPDGVVRRMQVAVSFDGDWVPPLAWAGPLVARGLDQQWMSPTKAGIRVSGREIALDREGRVAVRFRRVPDSLRRSALQLIHAGGEAAEGRPLSVPAEEYRGRHVILGETYAGRPAFTTPMGTSIHGAELRAIELDNWLRGDFLRPERSAWRYVRMVLLTTIAGLLALVLSSPWLSVPVILLAGLSECAYALHQYGENIAVPLAPSLASIVMAGAGAMVYRQGWEVRQRRYLDRAFGQYVPRHVIERLVENPELLRRGGEVREISVLFADIAGFTSMSEGRKASEVTTFLNAYFEDVGDVVVEHGGTIDKFVGDAIICFWNAPIDDEKHALHAVSAAIDCQKRFAERRGDYRNILGGDPGMRIGIATGPALVGNLGSPSRFDYTAIGDTVNLASRLEAANKAFGSTILLCPRTKEAVGANVPTVELGPIRVQGRHECHPVYTIWRADSDGTQAALARFEHARVLMNEGHLEAALRIFRSLDGLRLADCHAQECVRRLAVPDPERDRFWSPSK